MPVSEAPTFVPLPIAVMEPMVLLLMVIGMLLSDPMPNVTPPFPEVVTEIEPVPVPLPMVLPVTEPISAAPDST